MRVVLVDDEPLALRGLCRLLNDEPDVEVVGIARDGDDALRLVREQRPDLVFLDIEMPGLSGLEVAVALETETPDVIFVTAFDSHAAAAFSVDAVDYLLKPVRSDRLRQGLQRARRRQADHGTPRTVLSVGPQPTLLVPGRHGGLALAQSDIVWIEAARDYGLIHTDDRSYIIRTTMAELARRLDAGIVRVHRSAFVSLSRVRQLRSAGKGALAIVMDDGTEVQVGPSYAKSVRAALQQQSMSE